MSPSPARSEPSEEKYFFVNQNADTVLRTHRDAELDRSKQSHVQRQYVARRREANVVQSNEEQGHSRNLPFSKSFDQEAIAVSLADQESSSSSRVNQLGLADTLVARYDATRPPESQPIWTLASSLDSSYALPNVKSKPETWVPALLGAHHARQSISRIAAQEDEILRESPDNERVVQQIAQIISSASARGISDPFMGTYETLRRWAPPLTQYYTHVVIPEMFIIESRIVGLHHMRHANALHADIQACMANPAHMYSLLAASSSRMLKREGRLLLGSLGQGDPARVTLYFKTKAIKAVRQRLQDGAFDTFVAQDVNRLMAAAIFQDDDLAVEAHFNALGSIVRGLGGFASFGDYFKEKMILTDMHWATKTLQTPKILCAWDPGPLSDELRIEITSTTKSLALQFMPVTTSAGFTQVLKSMISGMIELVRLSFYALSGGALQQLDFKWMTLRAASLAHQLLNHSYREEDNSDVSEEPLRLALLFWLNMTLADPIYATATSKITQSLKISLENTDLQLLWPDCPGLFLWVITVGALFTNGGHESNWFMELAAKACKESMVEDFEALEESLSGFLYIPQIQRESLRELFSKIEILQMKHKSKQI